MFRYSALFTAFITICSNLIKPLRSNYRKHFPSFTMNLTVREMKSSIIRKIKLFLILWPYPSSAHAQFASPQFMYACMYVSICVYVCIYLFIPRSSKVYKLNLNMYPWSILYTEVRKQPVEINGKIEPTNLSFVFVTSISREHRPSFYSSGNNEDRQYMHTSKIMVLRHAIIKGTVRLLQNNLQVLWKVLTGFNRLKIGTSGRQALMNTVMNVRFNKRRVISWPHEWLLTSQEGQCSTELLSQGDEHFFFERMGWTPLKLARGIKKVKSLCLIN
jgi:hypothetical protein